MAFPSDPTDLDIEILLGGSWVNLRTSDYVLDRGITISRGRADEAGQIEPAKLSMTLDNLDGRFSPRNPTGPYYGLLGRNVPVRASVKRGSTFMEVLGDGTSKATCPDATALGITGDIDVRIDITTDSWGQTNLCGKYATTGNQRSWHFQVAPDGTLRLLWTTAGTSASAALAISTLGIPQYPGRMALRATLDVNNGASNNTTTFYTASTIAGPWTQLGDPIVGALGTSGTTSIFDSTAQIEVGNVADEAVIVPASDSRLGAAHSVAGRINAFELRSGIGGTVVANPVFTSQTIGATSFNDTATSANTWTLRGNAAITNRRWRFFGELSSLPPRWDVSGKDVYVPVEVDGILRRLRQNSAPLHSPLYRQTLGETGLIAYWPCEDGNNATSFAAATDNTRPGKISGTPSMSSSDVFPGSESLPTLGGSTWTFSIPRYTVDTSGAQISFLAYVPSDTPPANNTILARLTTSGSANRWDVVYTTASGGSVGLGVYANDDESGTSPLFSPTGVVTNNINDNLWLFTIAFQQSGTSVKFTFDQAVINGINGRTAAGTLVQTITTRTCGVATKLVISPNGVAEGPTIGHVRMDRLNPADPDAITNGYIGESAGRRIERLCTEEGIAFRSIGDLQHTPAMGPQTAEAFTDLVQECADADLGMLFEPRDTLGLGYRAHSSLYNQPARLALDYGDNEVSDSLDPTDDDQTIINDVTVSRTDGSSYRYQVMTGPLSVLTPPNGIGRYQGSVSINVAEDNQLDDQASWRAHIGTVDEARYPLVGADFAGPGFIGDADLNEQMLTLEVGDRLTVDNPPAWLPPDAITQIVQGMSETFGNYVHSMAFNTSPESPYRIGILGTSRIDTSGSALASNATSTGTSLSVATTDGALWTTDSGVMPFNVVVGGEVVRVTAISGTSSPQTFTVARSINGVVKAQLSGTSLHLASQEYVAL